MSRSHLRALSLTMVCSFDHVVSMILKNVLEIIDDTERKASPKPVASKKPAMETTSSVASSISDDISTETSAKAPSSLVISGPVKQLDASADYDEESFESSSTSIEKKPKGLVILKKDDRDQNETSNTLTENDSLESSVLLTSETDLRLRAKASQLEQQLDDAKI